MSTRLSGSLLLLVALVLLFNVGEFAAQDPAPATPAPQTTQPDLSGTYAGTFNCDALGLSGETTLTITGNQFTTADGKTGRIVASKSGGYTAVAFQVGEMNPSTPSTTQPSAAPQIVSMRARKSGNRLILTPAPGSTMKCSFTTGTMARGRRQRTPAATGTEVSAPAAAPAPTTAPTPAATPAEQPMPAQTPSPTPSPMPSPSPEPEPSPEPQPSPAPSPNPSPMPSPTATPSPTPSPTPTPRRG
jgi:hypothetical protein